MMRKEKPSVAKHARIADEIVCTRGKTRAKDATTDLAEVHCHWCAQALLKERAVWFLRAARAGETATALALASPCWSGPDDHGLEASVIAHVAVLESALADATATLTTVRSELERLTSPPTAAASIYAVKP